MKDFVPWYKKTRFRFLVFSLLIATLPLLLLEGISWNQARADLEKSLHARNVALAQKVASDTEVLFTGVIERLELSGSSLFLFQPLVHDQELRRNRLQPDGRSELISPPSIVDQPPGQARFGRPAAGAGNDNWQDFLYTILFRAPYLEALALFDGEGQEVAAVSRREVKPALVPRNFSQSREFQLADRGQVAYGAVRFEEDGRPLLDLVVPFPSYDGGPGLRGGFLAKVNLRGLWYSISRLSPGRHVSIYLVDQNGTLIAHDDFSQVLEGREVRGSQAVADLLAGRVTADRAEPKRYVSYQGQEVLGLSLPIRGPGWGVVVEEPVRTALAPVRALAWKFGAATLLVLVLVSLLAALFSVRLTAPLEKLFAGMKRVAQGDYDRSLADPGDDEMGRLVASFNGMVRELRKKREMELTLARAEKLAALGLLASGMAHELNNPLATLAAYTEDLKERWEGQEPSLVQRSEMEHYFSVIFNQVKRCKGITRSLLDLNHPEPAPGESLAVGPLLDEALQMVWPRAERQGVRILVFGVAEDVQIVADRRYLLQVLSNLLNNALDALEGRPEPQIQVEVDRVGEGVELIIRDNGAGLGEEARAHIFEPFFTTKPPGKGTGLGLFVAYQLTRKMRGEIALENEPRGGTRARVWFPGGPRDVG